MRLLFVCGRNRLRSPTAERLFAGFGDVETRSAGVNPDADETLSLDAIEWADLIFVMEPAHRNKMMRNFAKALRGKRVVCLGIKDEFELMDPALIELLWERVPRSVPDLISARPTIFNRPLSDDEHRIDSERQ